MDAVVDLVAAELFVIGDGFFERLIFFRDEALHDPDNGGGKAALAMYGRDNIPVAATPRIRVI